MKYFHFLLLIFSHYFYTINAESAGTGCQFTGSGQGRATCDYNDWDPPLVESDFNPGTIYEIVIEHVDGTIPDQVFSDIDSGNTNGKGYLIKFECNLENIILSPEVFTPNLDWVKELTFKNCYVQDGISSGMLSNLTSLEDFSIDGGIVGPIAADVFSGLTNLVTVKINADFLDSEIPDGLFSSLTQLEEIDLRSSGISSVPSGTFSNLKLLTKLDLSENSLTTLPQDLFTSLISLTTVELGSNAWNCSCDMAWLSSWSLYTGVTLDVTCSTPAEYAGVPLNRAVASMGCINSVVYTASDTVSNGSESQTSQNSENDNTLTYIAVGVAGFATLLATGLAIAMCCLLSKLDKLRTGDYWRNGRNKLPKTKTPEQTPVRQMSVSTINERPPSYKSTERMFINTPVQTQRDSRIHPYYNVGYKKGLLTSDA